MADTVDCEVSNLPDKFVVTYGTKDKTLESSAISADWEPHDFVFKFEVPKKNCHISSVVPSSIVKKLGKPSVSVDSGQVTVILKKTDKNVQDITQYFQKGKTSVQGKMGDNTLEPVDCGLKQDPKKPNEVMLVYGELDDEMTIKDIKIIPEKQPDESIIVKFTCKNLFHNSGPIPGAIWKDLDKGQKHEQDDVFCKWTLKKGNHKTMPDLKKYFEVADADT